MHSHVTISGNITLEQQQKLKQLQLKQQMRPVGYQTAYTIKSDDPREPIRVKNLQLLCFKLATHRPNITKLLEQYSQKHKPEHKNKDGIPLSELNNLMNELTKMVGIVLMTYDQYKQGLALNENSQQCLDQFEQYLYLQILQLSQTFKRKVSLLKKETTVKQIKNRVRFLEDGLKAAKNEGLSFKPEFFTYQIDKFFSKELNVVINQTNDEYETFLKKQEDEKKELQNTFNALDDFFFQATEPDKNEDLNKRDKEADEIIQKPDSIEDDLFKNYLQKTISDYEDIVKLKKYKNEKELKDLNKLLDTLRNQMQSHNRRNGDNSSKLEEPKDKEDINDLRKRGMQEIFNFYSRQHIPLNRQFDDLKEIMNEVDLGEYMKFCKDFEIPLSKSKITEIFKKTSINHKPHKFDQFFSSMVRVGKEMNKIKLQDIESQIQEVQRQLRQQGNRTSNPPTTRSIVQKDEVPSSYFKKESLSPQREQLDILDEKPIIRQTSQKSDQNNKARKDSLQSDKSEKQIITQQDEEERMVTDKSMMEFKSPKQKSSSKSIQKVKKVVTAIQATALLSSGSKRQQNLINGQLDQIDETEYLFNQQNSLPYYQQNSNDQVINPLEQQLNKLEEQKQDLQNKTDDDHRDDVLDHIQCHDPNKYRKRIKGFHQAFNITDKQSRVPPQETNQKLKKMLTKIPLEEIKKQTQEIKSKRTQEKLIKEKEHQDKHDKDREALRKIHEQLRKDKASGKFNNPSYQRGLSNDKNIKVTFGVIEKLNYKDFNNGIDGQDFKPEDIIDLDDHDSEDDEILKKFQQDNKVNDYNSQPFVRVQDQKKNAQAQDFRTQKSSKTETLSGLGYQKLIVDPLQEKIHAIKGQINGINSGIINKRGSLAYSSHNQSQVANVKVNQNTLHQNNRSIDVSDPQPIIQRDNIQDRMSKKRGGPVNQVNIQNNKYRHLSDSLESEPLYSSRPVLQNLSPVRQLNLPNTNNSTTYSKQIIKPFQQQANQLNNSLSNGINDSSLMIGMSNRPKKILRPVAQSLDTHQLLLQKSKQQQGVSMRESKANVLNRKINANKLADISQDQINLHASMQLNNGQNLRRYQQDIPQFQNGPGNTGYFGGIRQPEVHSQVNTSRDLMINRANQIHQKINLDKDRQINSILKLQENNLKKGLGVVRKAQL